MDSGTTVCFYLIIGIGVGAALWLQNDPRSGTSGLFQALSAPFFWPIYLPILLSRPTDHTSAASVVAPGPGRSNESDGMATLIAQVETELETALRSLNGWADNVLSGELHHITELRRALHQQANHIRELDRLLFQSSMEASVTASPYPDEVPQETPTEVPSPNLQTVLSSTQPQAARSAESDPAIASAPETISKISEHEQRRSKNITVLKQLRRRLYDDLISTLAWVRELVTMIHLAKFTGAPASRAQELVSQIATAVERLSDGHRAG